VLGKFTVILGAAGALLLLGCAVDGGGSEDAAVYRSGEYTASAESVGGPLWVAVSFTAQAIVSVRVADHNDTVSRPEVALALETVPLAIVASQSPEVDVVAGATVTSRRIMDAVKDCVAQAKK
jgi:fumarate reductase flavoprotein subunit